MPFRRFSSLVRLLHLAASRALEDRVSSCRMIGVKLLFMSLVCAAALAQSSLEQNYAQAAAQPSGARRIAALEDVVQRASGNPVRIDALEMLVWEYAHSNPQQAGGAARELFSADQANAMAIAVLNSGTGIKQSKVIAGERDDATKLGDTLRNLGALHRPRSISDAEFATMERWTYALLSGSVGMALFRSKDWAAARTYLQNALAVMPNNASWNYALGIADLDGANPRPQLGFEELAVAAILTQGTPEGNQIGPFALEKYKSAGGNAADWSRYLALARSTVAEARTDNSLPQLALVDFDAPSNEPSRAERVQRRTQSSRQKQAAGNSRPKKDPDTAIEEAINREPLGATSNDIPDLKQSHIVPFPPGEPVSLGILLEASIKKEDRGAVVQGLSNVVRRLRPNDEAFVLAFSNQLAFEQDLTQNYRLLERAVDDIKPDPGTALFDAVSFAAGHLRRIAKNRDQALLVISDGRNQSRRESPLQLASQINNVRIYCLGVGAGAAADKHALESLANYTGGQVAFISTPDQFEPALQSLAQLIYGPYPLQPSRR